MCSLPPRQQHPGNLAGGMHSWMSSGKTPGVQNLAPILVAESPGYSKDLGVYRCGFTG